MIETIRYVLENGKKCPDVRVRIRFRVILYKSVKSDRYVEKCRRTRILFAVLPGFFFFACYFLPFCSAVSVSGNSTPGTGVVL